MRLLRTEQTPSNDASVAYLDSSVASSSDAVPVRSRLSGRVRSFVRRSPTAAAGGGLVLLLGLLSLAAPFMLSGDPLALDPANRLQAASSAHWFGTDMYGRDVLTRLISGARTSLAVGSSVALFAVVIGVFIGLVSGYIRSVDGVVMRVMDGLMAIPGILLAIALIAVAGANLLTVIVAITVPDVPRVVRLVRSLVLSVREEPYVEGAVAAGTRVPLILLRHILPNTVAPLIVLASYLASSAILVEASLSFLGAGLPPEIPSWGNMIAEGRIFLQLRPELVFLPGTLLGLTVLGINLLGDGLRDELDPQLKQRL